jgi:hypothetical protein
LKLKGARFERPSTGRNITVSVWNLERISQASFNKLNYREQNKTTTQIRERERERALLMWLWWLGETGRKEGELK